MARTPLFSLLQRAARIARASRRLSMPLDEFQSRGTELHSDAGDFDAARRRLLQGAAAGVLLAGCQALPPLARPSGDEVAMAALLLAEKGFERGFVPESPKILVASRLLDHRQEQVLEFNAPSQPGDYDFICTFPGHHILMRGIMKVVK